MIFRQILQEDLGCASYFVGDEDSGRAAVIDPRADVDVYLELAEMFNVEITDVLETHTHADHVSGHGRLVELTGATIHVNDLAEASYPHSPLHDRSEVALGDVVIRAIHAPGHRPEHTAFAVIDNSRGPEPWALLSGDSLLVGDIARPDLAVGGEEGAELIHASLRSMLTELPPETELWPGHVGGSTCGSAAIDMKTSSTLAFERTHNPLLALERDEFVAALNAELGERPPNYENIVAINGGPLRTGAADPLAADPASVQSMLRDGAVAVDVRRGTEFDAGHIPGAVSFPAKTPGFATALARALGGEARLMLVGADEAAARRAARLTESVGLSRVEAVMSGGMAAWEGAGLETEALEEITPGELAERLADDGIQVVDVRTPATFAKGALPGSVSAVYTDLTEIPAGIDASRPVAVVCGTGRRAGIGAALLARAGAEQVVRVTPGGVAQARAGLREEVGT